MHKREASCFGSNCIPGKFNKREREYIGGGMGGLRLIENNSSRKITFSHLFPVTKPRTNAPRGIRYYQPSSSNPFRIMQSSNVRARFLPRTRWKHVKRYRRAEKSVIKIPIRSWKSSEQSSIKKKKRILSALFPGTMLKFVEISGCSKGNFVFFHDNETPSRFMRSSRTVEFDLVTISRVVFASIRAFISSSSAFRTECCAS